MVLVAGSGVGVSWESNINSPLPEMKSFPCGRNEWRVFLLLLLTTRSSFDISVKLSLFAEEKEIDIIIMITIAPDIMVRF